MKWTASARAAVMRAQTEDNSDLIEQAIAYAEEMAELAHASAVDIDLWRHAWNDARHTMQEPHCDGAGDAMPYELP